MISNQEFIKTQAYEISWAVFRCAELFSQSKLREEIESAAINLIAERSFASGVAAEGDLSRIEKLTSLIRLAESVGQIATINANVLYRELDNLSRAIRVNIAERQKKGNITASLEQMFTNPAYAKSIAQSAEQTDSVAHGASAVNSANQFGSIESLLSAAVLPNKPIDREVSSAVTPYVKQATQTPVAPVEIGMPKKPVPAMVKPAVSASNAAPAGSWQYVILQKVKDLGQTTTKELTASFPEISERTIRFYLQKLVDNGAIDRIGSTGPGSAYRSRG